MRGGSPALLLLAATASTQSFECGPNPHEVGQLVLMATPAVYVLGVAIVTLLLWLWRHDAPAWPARWTRLAALGAVHCALAALVWPTLPPEGGKPTHLDPGTLLIAVWLYGTSYATVMLVAARAAIRLAPRHASLLAHAAQLVLFSLPAFLLAHDRLKGTWWWGSDHAEDFFTVPGMGGWVPGPIFLLLLVEVLLRRRMRRRRPA